MIVFYLLSYIYVYKTHFMKIQNVLIVLHYLCNPKQDLKRYIHERLKFILQSAYTILKCPVM